MSSSRSKAFTLVEVLISLAVMAIALLALVHVLTWGMKAQRKTESANVARMLADRLLDRAVRELPIVSEFWAGDYSSQPWAEGDEVVGRDSFHHTLTAAEVRNSLTGRAFGAGQGAEDNSLRVLLVRVAWAEERSGSNIGNRELVARRMVNRRPAE